MEYPTSTAEITGSALLLIKCESLNSLLEHADPKLDEWQSDCGRLVALLAVALLQNEVGDDDYLRAVVAIRRAQLAGVKEAKKKNINAARFQASPPPELTFLNNLEDRRSAVEVLSRIRADWCHEYIGKCLNLRSGDKAMVAELAKWTYHTSSSVQVFLKTFVQAVISLSEDVEFKIRALKEAHSCIARFAYLSAADAGVAILSVSECIAIAARAVPNDEKMLPALFSLCQSQIEVQLKSNPLVLLEANFIAGIQTLSHTFQTTNAGQSMLALKRSLATATVSVLGSLLARGGVDQAKYWRPMMIAWRNTYPDFKSSLDAMALCIPVMSRLFDGEDNELTLDSESTVIPVYARLLPEWHLYKSKLADPSTVAALDSMIQEAASVNGVEYLGMVGEICSLDPILHHMVDRLEAVNGRVKIIRPGIIFRRPDGTFRVLVTALVTSLILEAEHE